MIRMPALRRVGELRHIRVSSSSVITPNYDADDDWRREFRGATSSLRSDISFHDSANQLRELCKRDLVSASMIRDSPSRFFEAHRELARNCVDHGPGFWIRFTVHYNLFAGTILAVGNEDQVKELDEIQSNGQLGCFSLTEKFAGVQSGLVVETKATYDPERAGFVLSTPHRGARKNWISQGFTADKTVVLADLVLPGGESRGPHAFVMDLRENGALTPGVRMDDMGRKTTGNDLDNAWIAFNGTLLPRSALLSRHCDVTPDGKYVLKSEGIKPFEMIGQRLYTGRVAVAQAALEYRKELFRRTKAYSDQKSIPGHGRDLVLSDIPQLEALYQEHEQKLEEVTAFVSRCEAALSECLTIDRLPPPDLVEAIATAKVIAVEESIELCFRLKQEVGSFALMADSGFKHLDFLQCCKFAEGDSRILMQKLARDRFREFVKGLKRSVDSDGVQLVELPLDDESVLDGEWAQSLDPELKACVALQAKLEEKGVTQSSTPAQQLRAWDLAWREVYALAHAVMERVKGKMR